MLWNFNVFLNNRDQDKKCHIIDCLTKKTPVYDYEQTVQQQHVFMRSLKAFWVCVYVCAFLWL